MNNKITNPFLKQMISEISSQTVKGRMLDINWSVLTEAKKKKTLKKEAAKRPPQPPQEDPNAGTEDVPEQPPQGAAPEAGGGEGLPDLGGGAPDAGGDAGLPDLGGGDAAGDPMAGAPNAGGGDASPEDAEQAQADAEEAKADVEQAKAEKDQAEKELEDQAYIKINSHGGTQFLLSKILSSAFKTNTIDALASEMVGKLKIDTPEDMSAFIEELAPFMTIQGMAQLVSSMKGLATKQSPAADNNDAAPEENPEM
jgi:hypothetical protein